MRPLYPQDDESQVFQVGFSNNTENKAKTRKDQNDFTAKFFNLNPDFADQQTRSDQEVKEDVKQSGGFSNISENLSPLQDNIYTLGILTKAWKKVFSYGYFDEFGLPLPFFSTIKAGTNLDAGISKATIELLSVNTSVSLVPNNVTKQLNIETNKTAVQPKSHLTIGYSVFNDFVCAASNPLLAFNDLITFVATSNIKTAQIEGGTYLFSSTLIIPSEIDLTLTATQGACTIASSVAVTVQFGTATPPSGAFWQNVEGIDFDSVVLKSTGVVNFKNCVLAKLDVGTNTAEYPLKVRFRDCDIFGRVDFVNAQDISFFGGFIDCLGDQMAIINQSTNIRFYGTNIINISGAAAMTLIDSVGIPTGRIMLSDCNLEAFAATPLIADTRANVLSTQLKMSGMLTNVTLNLPSYANPATNRFDFSP